MTESIPHYNAHSAAYPPPVNVAKYQSILDKVPDVEPDPYDVMPSEETHMPWSYRVSKQTMRNGDEIFAIRDFYGTDCKSWSQNEIAPSGDSVEDLRWVLTKMLDALDKPVIDIGDY